VDKRPPSTTFDIISELDRVMLLWSRLTADEKAQMLIDIEQNGFERT
jgi:hypothetical protein